MEQAFLERLRVFKYCKANKNVNGDLFIFKVHDTLYKGFDSIVQLPVNVNLVFIKNGINVLDKRLAERLVSEGLSLSQEEMSTKTMAQDMNEESTDTRARKAKDETAKTVAQESKKETTKQTGDQEMVKEHHKALANEISDFMKCCFRFGDRESRHHSLVFFADVSRVFISKEYLVAKKLDTCFNDDDDEDDDDLDDYDDDGVMWCMDDEDNEDDVSDDDLNLILKNVRLWQRVPDDLVIKPSELLEVKPAFAIKKLELMALCDEEDMEMLMDVDREKEEIECSICYKPLAGKVTGRSKVVASLPKPHSWDVVKLKCGHGFHYHCIFNWLPENQSCPCCRSSSLTYV